MALTRPWRTPLLMRLPAAPCMQLTRRRHAHEDLGVLCDVAVQATAQTLVAGHRNRHLRRRRDGCKDAATPGVHTCQHYPYRVMLLPGYRVPRWFAHLRRTLDRGGCSRRLHAGARRRAVAAHTADTAAWALLFAHRDGRQTAAQRARRCRGSSPPPPARCASSTPPPSSWPW